MVKIKHIVRYFAQNYPYKSELSKTRITKMVYLADWYSVLNNGKQLTNIKWYFDHYGPYVPDVYEVVRTDNLLKIQMEESAFGNEKAVIGLRENTLRLFGLNGLDKETKDILDDVIDNTKNLYWTDFINYVYSSYPIKTSRKYKNLDLIKLAKDCHEKDLEY